MSAEERREKVLDMLQKYLTAFGIGVEPDKLAERFRNVDITGGDQEAILDAVSKYLEDDAKIATEQLKQILKEGPQLLGTILPGLGIETKPLISDNDVDLPKAPTVKRTTFIENVADFKASLGVTAGPRPVVDLSEYEELEPKL